MNEKQLFDKRLISRNIEKDLIAAKDFEQHLKELPDREEEGEWICIEDFLANVGSNADE